MQVFVREGFTKSDKSATSYLPAIGHLGKITIIRGIPHDAKLPGDQLLIRPIEIISPQIEKRLPSRPMALNILKGMKIDWTIFKRPIKFVGGVNADRDAGVFVDLFPAIPRWWAKKTGLLGWRVKNLGLTATHQNQRQ